MHCLLLFPILILCYLLPDKRSRLFRQHFDSGVTVENGVKLYWQQKISFSKVEVSDQSTVRLSSVFFIKVYIDMKFWYK
jgi:hypothetical protein